MVGLAQPCHPVWGQALRAGTPRSDSQRLERPGEPAQSLNQPTLADGGGHRAGESSKAGSGLSSSLQAGPREHDLRPGEAAVCEVPSFP